MAVYLIDFENVHEAGLGGVEKLTEQDYLCVFYSAASQSLTLDTVAGIMERRVPAKCIRCDRSGKNYLDFQLATYLGMLAAQGKYRDFVIVSKDRGYESLVDFWDGTQMENHTVTCRLQEKISLDGKKKPEKTKRPGRPPKAVKQEQQVRPEQIVKAERTEEQKKRPDRSKSEKLPDFMKKKVRNAVKELELKPTDYTAIYKAILRNTEEEKFTNMLKSTLGKEKGGKAADTVKEIFTEFRGEKKTTQQIEQVKENSKEN